MNNEHSPSLNTNSLRSPEAPQTLARNTIQRGFYKNWYLRLSDPVAQRALWLRFTVLSSGNGFKRIAETWAIYFQRMPNKEVKKVALKQTHDIQAFLASSDTDIRIGACELLPGRSRGNIQSKGQSIQWDLSILPSQESPVRFVPEILSKTGLVKNSIVTVCEELLCTGTTQINGETIHWKDAVGMQGYLNGNRNGHSWTWGHCNTFVNESGKPVPFLFEGFNARTQIGPMLTPRLSSFYFYYSGQHYHFNTLRDAIYIKSKNTLNEWEFQADRDDLSFRGRVRAEYKDFVGLTYEDTNGSLLYCSNSELADMTIHVYRRGKLESAFIAPGCAAFDIVSREKNPYVPLLI